MKQVVVAIRALVFMTVLTGILYPVIVTGLSYLIYPQKSAGSFLSLNGVFVGSELIAQKFENKKYFWPRPSAVDYNASSSGASNLSMTSADLKKQVFERANKLGGGISNLPQDLLFASGSGLDPHISPAAAEYQIARVAAERNIEVQALSRLVKSVTEPPQFGVFGEARVNVLKLNLALDTMSSVK